MCGSDGSPTSILSRTSRRSHASWRSTSFPWDSQQALSFALIRTYAVASIGRLLVDTREFSGAVQKRHDDTAILLETIAAEGTKPADGRAGVRRLNQMHGRYDISNDDMRYVLATFVVIPVRWIGRYGWRRGMPTDRIAAVRYHQRLGAQMAIYGHFRGLRRIRRPDGRRRARHLRSMPRRGPSRAMKALAPGSLRMRGRFVRLMPPRRKPKYLRSTHRIRSYLGEFMIDKLGTFPSSPPFRGPRMRG